MVSLWLSITVFFLQILSAVLQEGIRDDSRVESVVRQAVADEFSSEILTNRTRAFLSCASGEMVVKLNFSEPFRGITYTDYDRTSPCRFYGDGSKYYQLRIPLKGCGTRQEAPRVFVNNIIVRFHRSLQLEEDEIKTIICRYPPPLAPTPNNAVAPIIEPAPAAAAVLPPKLSEVELLLIICALLFLTLLLLGIGVAYYCLKKRNIKVIKRKKAMSSAPGSAITKLSGSTMGSLMFDQIRIPRAIAQSISGSEAALLTTADRSDTIPSDYPSESPSSINSDAEEMEGRRSILVSETSTTKHDKYRYENTAFIPDEGSVRSGYPLDQERDESVSSVPITTLTKPPEKRPRLKTKIAMEQLLTTISEREDILQQESIDRRYAKMTEAKSDIRPPPPYIQPQIASTQTRVKRRPPSLYGSIPDNDNWSQSEVESRPPVQPYIRQPNIQTATYTDYLIDTQDLTDTIEDTTRHQKTTTQLLEEERALVPRKPKIMVQNIDDVYVTTTTETIATEHVTKHTRDTIEPLEKAPTPSPSWDVTIRHYPTDITDYSNTVTDKYQVTSRTEESSHPTSSPQPPPPPPPPPPPAPPTTTHSPDWDVLIRVLQPPRMEGIEELNIEDKETWRTLITTNQTFRSLIQEATTVEEYIKISEDVRYENLFSREAWTVIIKILTIPPLNPPAETLPQPSVYVQRYRKRSEGMRRPSYPNRQTIDADMRSVTEYDMDFTRAERESLWSVDTGCTYRTSRSIAERSTSEFVEDVPTYFRSHPPPLERSSSEFVTVPDTISSGRFASSSSEMRSYSNGAEVHRSTRSRDNHALFERSSTEIIINSPILEAIHTNSERQEIDYK
ncbi:uncharacterized protein LOC111636369 [Centruroides sculpturatus]|uniref:uncharacterized protein LOC111636369 n=1 Tax=Centruroides sculpturatus TaxID=218467 RepID=UPI000C6E96A3|nr:uncharacterized protein LOC111636369 [Centruroides sculpturatus]XP_023237372.1 uncharacterized protein LOC111636369 [Centruroides sculpturatus]XP_023237373.1 uncharacterized protein LOC111636369 [Centruroides sculpturatus]